MITHCERMQDRFAILDPQRGATPTNGIRAQRGALNSDRGYAALYYPWIWISNPDPNVEGRLLVPPSGHIAGIFARSDDTEGVHKAPANEQVRGASSASSGRSNDAEQGRSTSRASTSSAGCSTGASASGARARSRTRHAEWHYVNVRRLLLFLEESIQEGTAVRGLRAQQPGAVAEAQAHDHRLPDPGLARRRARSAPRRGGVLRAHRRGAQPAGGARARAALIIEIGVGPTSRRPSSSSSASIQAAGRPTARGVLSEASKETHDGDRTASRPVPATSTSWSRSTASRRPASPSAAASAPTIEVDRVPRGRREHHRRASCPGMTKLLRTSRSSGASPTPASSTTGTATRSTATIAAQERLDHPARPRRPGEGALELLQRLAQQVGRPGLQRQGQRRRDRDARARARAARAGLSARRHACSRPSTSSRCRWATSTTRATLHRDGRDAAGDGGRRDPAAARTRACRATRPT